jgi:hypothetical protein
VASSCQFLHCIFVRLEAHCPNKRHSSILRIILYIIEYFKYFPGIVSLAARALASQAKPDLAKPQQHYVQDTKSRD